ncbi:GntR family transcriptional regulator [Halodesulfovibrio marinisediminis]|uniref:DNA-binding transcriptional regulator, GntR family n=1 Tax=Halodesulfovibrio marinisediminis DSM 17456 TaxID=1121457 RepID=A0A1N6IAT7_9BACT|nr:GntR family transcriptional regulator [Halodesulfovibrio marinisediminis]SIO29124.1 DNA-binding transcriptional regulator, GntR family [Halodesulfovibrio marinisediminis DSM 17456]
MKDSSPCQQVADHLEDLILSGQLLPRERLGETDMAERFSVKRHVIRDAFKILESKGLIEIKRYKGARVVSLSMKEISDVFDIRINLERFAYSLALNNMREEDFAELEAIAQKFMDSVDSSIEELSRLNTAFHNIIYKRADNIPLLEIITDLHIKLYITRFAAWDKRENIIQSGEEHFEFIEALRKKELDVLNDLARRHIYNSKIAYEKRVSKITPLALCEKEVGFE